VGAISPRCRRAGVGPSTSCYTNHHISRSSSSIANNLSNHVRTQRRPSVARTRKPNGRPAAGYPCAARQRQGQFDTHTSIPLSSMKLNCQAIPGILAKMALATGLGLERLDVTNGVTDTAAQTGRQLKRQERRQGQSGRGPREQPQAHPPGRG
jgi:hypothetical protein